ncbi:methyl-accepting chemotaxis protein [Paenibacillus sp. NFR01]|uniref:methyl-accepting chemotaxis protein n=1 Tax=Paenibacillus sp. NFR01 TaxID=1566279 RepID=UPI0008D3602E|nr:methyl-accepting chemotaxis protein [Paenibacillus sp. NFR01]SEU23154.1 methyl-accepting chemotaxis protein [Paenibacillus sp. NFR01]
MKITVKPLRAAKRIKLSSVKSRLIVSFVLLLLVPSLAIGGFAYKTAENKVDDQLANLATTDISLVSHTVDQFIQPKMNDVGTLLEQSSLDNIDDILHTYTSNHSEVEEAGIVKSGKEYLSSAGGGAATSGELAQDSDFYTQALENKGTVILTEPYTSETTGNTVVAVAKSSTDGQSATVVVLSLKSLQDLVGELKIGQDGFVVVFSSSGSSIVSPPWGTGGQDAGAAGEGGAPPAAEGAASADGSGAVPADGTGVTPTDGDAPEGTGAGQPSGGEGGGQPGGMFTGESGQITQVSPEGTTRNLIYITNALTGWKIAGDRSPIEVTHTAAPILHNTLIVIGIALLVGAILMSFMIRSITRPLKALIRSSQIISRGDLSQRVMVNAKDEFGELGASFNAMVDSLRSVVSEVDDSASQLAAASQELSANADQTSAATEYISGSTERMSDGAGEQVKRITESRQITLEMTEAITHIAERAADVADTAAVVAEKSTAGGQAVQSAILQMDSISGSVNGLAGVIGRLVNASQEIGQIIEVISELSQKTNLLSLNAAIEAARAGEHGRGFAVVAGEVKKLAEQSTDSTEQVAALIVAIREEIGKVEQSMRTATKEVGLGMGVVHTAGSLFAEIEQSVAEVNRQVAEVSDTTGHISSRSQQVVQAMDTITEVSELTATLAQSVSASTEEQMASMQEIASSSSYLTRMAEELRNAVDKFKL